MYFLQTTPEQINGRMAIQNGKVLVHLRNYITIHDQVPPKSMDATVQVFAIDPLEDDVNRVMDGGKEHIYLWRGNKRGRDNDADLVSVPILPVDVAMGVPKASAGDVARAAFADFPEPIRIAGVLLTVSPEMLAALPANTSQLKAWAEQTMQQSVAETAAGT